MLTLCPPQWVGAPSCQRGSYAFYKSVSSRAQPDGPLQVWKLGEFYFIQCGPEDPVCIAEVTLLWEDQARRHLLASARLYFLPEDTPKGRTREHGEVACLRICCFRCLEIIDIIYLKFSPQSLCHQPNSDFYCPLINLLLLVIKIKSDS
ncbi:AT-rich interactive domain-containing protein 5B-like [Poecilia latipinna]|nr:PREDICTED: AT-rich interactive domain-containing protein 5B-like [Poecilia latipinna]